MMGAYSIRRLIDSRKSSSRLPGRQIRTKRYSLAGRKPMHLDHFNPEHFYDMTKPLNAQLEVGKLCNQIIHSFVFQLYLEEDATTSVVFISDRDRDKHLHGVGLEVLAELFDYVGREDVIEQSGTMRQGEQTITNVSNHDVVESGRATYADAERVDIEWVYEELPVFDERLLEMVQRRMNELRNSGGGQSTSP